MTIAQLRKSKRQENDKLAELGMWNCEKCLRLNAVEDLSCKYCLQSKFPELEEGADIDEVGIVRSIQALNRKL